MQEFRILEAGKELGIPKTEGQILAKQLQEFVELQASRWNAGDDLHRGRFEPGFRFSLPSELPESGVKQNFLVIWRSSGIYSGMNIHPMIIWLARGEQVGRPTGNDALYVKYNEVGTLAQGQREIVFSEDPKEIKLGHVYFTSPVIIPLAK